MQVKEKIFKDTNYEPINISIYNYLKIYKIIVLIYKYKEKRYYYNKANDPKYFKL
jgi:hypothetical protein